MKQSLFRVLAILLLAAVFASSLFVLPASAATPPATSAYYSGIYRNLFKEAGYSDTEVQSKINTAWNQLFYGNAQQKIYYTVGTDMAYMKDVYNNDMRTEGQSYGMMIAVQLNNTCG